MKIEDINDALLEAVYEGQYSGVTLSMCDLAKLCQPFLKTMSQKGNWLQGAAFRAAHGAISKWREANGC